MTTIMRRQMLQTLSGTSLAALFAQGIVQAASPTTAVTRPASTAREPSPTSAAESASATVLRATLTLDHRQGRRLEGFIETGIKAGIVLCTLTEQYEENPAVQSVFASRLKWTADGESRFRSSSSRNR